MVTSVVLFVILSGSEESHEMVKVRFLARLPMTSLEMPLTNITEGVAPSLDVWE
jgi:hypothetical protein